MQLFLLFSVILPKNNEFTHPHVEDSLSILFTSLYVVISIDYTYPPYNTYIYLCLLNLHPKFYTHVCITNLQGRRKPTGGPGQSPISGPLPFRTPFQSMSPNHLTPLPIKNSSDFGHCKIKFNIFGGYFLPSVVLLY